MWIRDFWNRVLAKFRKEDSTSEPVMELKTEQAPEPVPERKTSDEVIIQMADSTLEEDGRMMPPAQERAEEQPEAPSVQDGEDCTETPAPEFDDWAEEAVPEYEDETDGI